mmetsp:Transcript_72742/g.194121  ORF Transcript_72742/g.194121 Transcript_72742/m.194121 type:complete len:802 (+) Transcript_72742:106-2511(+)
MLRTLTWLAAVATCATTALSEHRIETISATQVAGVGGYERVVKVLNGMLTNAQGELDVSVRLCESQLAQLRRQVSVADFEDSHASEAMGSAIALIDAGHNDVTKASERLERLQASVEVQRHECLQGVAMRKHEQARARSDLHAAQGLLARSNCTAGMTLSLLQLCSSQFGTRVTFDEDGFRLLTSEARQRVEDAVVASAPPAFVQTDWVSEAERLDDVQRYTDYFLEAPAVQQPRLLNEHEQFPLTAFLSSDSSDVERSGESQSIPDVGEMFVEARSTRKRLRRRSGADPVVDESDDGQTRAKQQCTIHKNPTCGIFEAHLSSLVGQMVDSISAADRDIAKFDAECTNEVDNLNSQIQQAIAQQALGAQKLAQGQADRSQQMAVVQQLKVQRRSSFHALKQAESTCGESQAELEERLCAAKKMKAELAKLSSKSTTVTECQVSEWVPETCSKSCGGGVRQLHRHVVTPPSPAAVAAQCPPLRMSEPCNTQPCSTDCALDEWGGWGKCSADCGGGVQMRNREVLVQAALGGDPCPTTVESRPCNTHSCERKCELGEWQPWRPCTSACGGGMSWRRRPIAREGTTCPENLSPVRLQQQACNTQNCPTTIRCNSLLDVIFILDGSGTVREPGFDAQKAFLRNITSSMQCGAKARAGVVVMSKVVSTVQALTGDCEKVKAAASATPYPGAVGKTSGGKEFGRALATARELLSGSRQQAESVVVVLTDASPGRRGYEDVDPEIQQTKRVARLVFGVLPTSDDAMEKVQQWASFPATANVFSVDSLGLLQMQVNTLIAKLCPVLVSS